MNNTPTHCKHWRDCGHPRGGCCAIGAFDRPSFGVCRRCTSFEPLPPEAPETPETLEAQEASAAAHTGHGLLATLGHAAGSLARGAAGLAQAKTGMNRADAVVIAQRLAICETCEHSRPTTKPVVARRCGVLMDALRPDSAPCGCGLANKTSLKGQACPLGKWEAASKTV